MTKRIKITEFNRKTCCSVSEQIEAHLAGLADELGIKITSKGGSYSDTSYTLKIECATISEDGQVQTKEATDFALYASRYGLEADDLGKTFTRSGDLYTIVGCKPRSRKYPILVRKSGGKLIKFPADTVRLHLQA